MTVDYLKAAAADPTLKATVTQLQRAAGINLRKVPYDVWVGPDGRFRQLRFVVRTGAGVTAAKTTMTITIPSYNVPVTIKAPPKALVAEG